MKIELTPEQLERKAEFKAFVDVEVMPYADQFDREEQVPARLLGKLAEAGYLGAFLPTDCGGMGLDSVSHGLLCEQIGRGSASLLSLLTAHGMVCAAIHRWGSEAQRLHWLPPLARGERIAAFGLTEPDIGSDGRQVRTDCTPDADAYVVHGTKKWVSFGQIADVFLIIAQCEGQPAAVLVERSCEGLSCTGIGQMLGFRAAMLADVRMQACRLPQANLIGRLGFGFSHVAGAALDHGRYCIGWGCVGLGQACLDASLSYTSERKQFGVFLKAHQLIQKAVTEMVTNLRAARLLCYQAAYLRQLQSPESIMATTIAKYFAAVAVNKMASDAVQIHGANGCSANYPVQRYMRDAKIMEIIEGSNQLLETVIAEQSYFSTRH
jgi:alkylation response protein AidB-like acyl-CoA dehydrogenase